jgi:uncharacterized protein (TIGR00255 family)
MTGFGKAVGSHEGQEISIEASTVNHRYLDASVRMPNGWSALEPDMKQFVRDYISRGKLFINVNRKRSAEAQSLRFEPETARQYIEASKELSSMLGGFEKLSVDVLAQLEGVFVFEEPDEDLEQVQKALEQLLSEALSQLNEMREREGEKLSDDVKHRLGLLRQSLASVEERLPQLNAKHEERLRSRIDEIKADLSLTEERIAVEVAMMAEKADVTEEVVRLKSHLEHMDELLESKDPVGRRIDFLLQELQREVNTLGVKTRDSEASKDVLDMKAELEKIREQAQNIE